jgi:hypothetical protein
MKRNGSLSTTATRIFAVLAGAGFILVFAVTYLGENYMLLLTNRTIEAPP